MLHGMLRQPRCVPPLFSWVRYAGVGSILLTAPLIISWIAGCRRAARLARYRLHSSASASRTPHLVSTSAHMSAFFASITDCCATKSLVSWRPPTLGEYHTRLLRMIGSPGKRKYADTTVLRPAFRSDSKAAVSKLPSAACHAARRSSQNSSSVMPD
eukprot:scaffold37804_cov67-Phaeocystis_antarctica.AAC.4